MPLLVILSASEESWYASIVTPARYKPQGTSYKPIMPPKQQPTPNSTWQILPAANRILLMMKENSLLHHTGPPTFSSFPKSYEFFTAKDRTIHRQVLLTSLVQHGTKSLTLYFSVMGIFESAKTCKSGRNHQMKWPDVSA